MEPYNECQQIRAAKRMLLGIARTTARALKIAQLYPEALTAQLALLDINLKESTDNVADALTSLAVSIDAFDELADEFADEFEYILCQAAVWWFSVLAVIPINCIFHRHRIPWFTAGFT